MPIEQPPEKRFIFNGSAVAFAGRIRRPEDHFVKAAAASHLPVTGGLSEAHLEGPGIEEYHYKDFITFKRAHSRSHGDFSDPREAVQFTHGNHGKNELRAETTVETTLEGFKIDAPPDPEHNTPRRVFEVKTLRAYTASTSNRQDPVSFHALTATFDGVTLASGTSDPVEVKVQTATEAFCQNDTRAKLIATYAADGDFRKKYAACFHPIGATLPGFLGRILGMGKHDIPNAEKGPIVATFVTGLQFPENKVPEGIEVVNNRLTIPGLGRIYFGEIVIEENSRRTTLLRFELGSHHGGDASAGECVTNGSNTDGA